MARPSLFKNRKFARLVHTLALPEPYVLGHLEYLWHVAYEAGDPVMGDALDVELAAKWAGDRGRLAEALAEVGFLDRLEDGRFAIHDFDDHAPEYVRTRIRVRRFRQRGREQRNRDVTLQSRNHNVTVTYGNGIPVPVPVPVPGTDPGTPEVGSTGKADPGTVECAEPSRNDASAPPSPPLLRFPVVGPHGPTWALTADQVERWQQTYPTIDVLAEARKALAWIEAHPDRRKTARGMPRFLNRWLSQATDRGGIPRPTPPPEPPPRTLHTELLERLRDSGTMSRWQIAEYVEPLRVLEESERIVLAGPLVGFVARHYREPIATALEALRPGKRIVTRPEAEPAEVAS